MVSMATVEDNLVLLLLLLSEGIALTLEFIFGLFLSSSEIFSGLVVIRLLFIAGAVVVVVLASLSFDIQFSRFLGNGGIIGGDGRGNGDSCL